MREPGHLLTAAELDELAERWKAAQHGPVKLLTPLPRKVRLRLWASHQVDRLAIWLVSHGRPLAGELVWRACGRW